MKITIVSWKSKGKNFTGMRSLSTQRPGRYRTPRSDIADEKTPDGAAPALEQQIIEKEGAQILSCIREDAYVIALAIQGKQRLSEQFGCPYANEQTDQWKEQYLFQDWWFTGLSSQVLKRADETG